MSEKTTSPPDSTAGDKQKIRSRLVIDFTPLRTSPDYRRLYIGQSVSAFGSAISYVVLPWQMYQLTRSSFAVGMLGVAEFVPMVLAGFIGGAIADYVDRRRLVLLAEVGLTLCCLVLFLNSRLVRPQPAVLFAVAALFAA